MAVSLVVVIRRLVSIKGLATANRGRAGALGVSLPPTSTPATKFIATTWMCNYVCLNHEACDGDRGCLVRKHHQCLVSIKGLAMARQKQGLDASEGVIASYVHSGNDCTHHISAIACVCVCQIARGTVRGGVTCPSAASLSAALNPWLSWLTCAIWKLCFCHTQRRSESVATMVDTSFLAAGFATLCCQLASGQVCRSGRIQ